MEFIHAISWPQVVDDAIVFAFVFGVIWLTLRSKDKKF